MRCLTLADGLSSAGGEVMFVCRAHDGHLADFIQARGYEAALLPIGPDCGDAGRGRYPAWLGDSEAADAAAVSAIARQFAPDWLIVDHYALGAGWEEAVRKAARLTMAIDDLADRPHSCDLLLDQNLGRQASDYVGLIPRHTELLAGSRYAILRPEFAELRHKALARRTAATPQSLLIALGGVDADDITGRTLELLKYCAPRPDIHITVVLGPTAPWCDRVRTITESMPWPTRLVIGAQDMAALIAEADVAIGGAGSSAWERCCLGLPTIMWVLAENQHVVADALVAAEAAVTLNPRENDRTIAAVISRFLLDGEGVLAMSRRAADIVDGAGCDRVLSAMGGVDVLGA